VSISLEFALLVLTVALLAAFLFQSYRITRVVRELTNRESRLERATCRDDLTGLTNRRVLQEILAREVAQARRSEGHVGLAILDLDDLKLVNDGLGFAAGDLVLKTVADRLTAIGRDSDTLARLGGDQFALVVSRCGSAEDVVTAIYRLRQAWQAPLLVDGQELRISCSIGLSVFPDDAGDASELLGHAGSALLKAQELGFDSLCLFDDSSNRLARERLVRSQELKRALERGELELYLQPQVSLPDGTLTGAEGLVRWHHPEQGLLAAGEFIPLAEQIGLMPQLSSWVLEEICRRNAAWLTAGLPVVPISVNVSVRHFQTGEVPRVVGRTLARNGLDPRWLHLEVTESAALHDVDLMTEQFEALRELGVGLQLDDFGTGYSSLSYLMRYPLDALKIDRSFVAGLHFKDESRAIVKATLAMSRSLGLEVIAEGVETEDELGCLLALGCDRAQGYLLGRPMPCADFERILECGRIDLRCSYVA
jgi:diguanylate cyclase (GGDEF)-like protein